MLDCMKLIYLHFYAACADSVGDALQFVAFHFFEIAFGRGAIERIKHHFQIRLL